MARLRLLQDPDRDSGLVGPRAHRRSTVRVGTENTDRIRTHRSRVVSSSPCVDQPGACAHVQWGRESTRRGKLPKAPPLPEGDTIVNQQTRGMRMPEQQQFTQDSQEKPRPRTVMTS
ncbi:hypothetical protein IF2G_03930 [Cordyceps javanica]|nr:hypothetical protein IF2G_03930 [Cordyceps javanica]